MTGAPRLVAHAAMRTGAGMVHLSIPGMTLTDAPIEIVQRPLPSASWADAALASLERFHAIVVGPGLGRSDDTAASIRRVVVEAPLPMVIDGDGLFALGWSSEGAATLLRRRRVPTILTPHDGEYALLSGSQPGADRMVAARRLAADSGCTVLLKGAATIVADPNGACPRCDRGRRPVGDSGHRRCAQRDHRRVVGQRHEAVARGGGRGVGARSSRAAEVNDTAWSPATCPI